MIRREAAGTVQSGLPKDAVVLGRVLRPHGLRGELKFSPFGCDRELLLKVRDVLLGPRAREVRIIGVRGSGRFWILALEGVESRNQAKDFQGLAAWIREDQLPPLAPSELYVASVIDAVVRDETGRRLGIVAEVMETAENDVLIVKREDGTEELIPALRSVLVGWDAESRVLTVRWSTGESLCGLTS